MTHDDAIFEVDWTAPDGIRQHHRLRLAAEDRSTVLLCLVFWSGGLVGKLRDLGSDGVYTVTRRNDRMLSVPADVVKLSLSETDTIGWFLQKTLPVLDSLCRDGEGAR